MDYLSESGTELRLRGSLAWSVVLCVLMWCLGCHRQPGGASGLSLVATDTHPCLIQITVIPPGPGFLVILGDSNQAYPMLSVRAGGECVAMTRFRSSDAGVGEVQFDGTDVYLREVPGGSPEVLKIALPLLLVDSAFEQTDWPDALMLNDVKELTIEVGFIPKETVTASDRWFSTVRDGVLRFESRNLDHFWREQVILRTRFIVCHGKARGSARAFRTEVAERE